MRNASSMPLPSMPSNERMIAEVKKLRKTIIEVVVLLLMVLVIIIFFYNHPISSFSELLGTNPPPSPPPSVIETMREGSRRMGELKKQHPNMPPYELSNMVAQEDYDKAHKK